MSCQPLQTQGTRSAFILECDDYLLERRGLRLITVMFRILLELVGSNTKQTLKYYRVLALEIFTPRAVAHSLIITHLITRH